MKLPHGNGHLENYEELYEQFQVLKKLKGNMPLFGRVCFPSAISKAIAPFHHEICKSLGDLSKNRVLVSAPRGTAKSTWFNLVYPLWRIAFKSSSEDVFIVIISEAQSQSINFLSRIKYHLNTSVKFRELFGDLGEKTAIRWTSNDVILANKVRIVALGTGQRVRGFIEGDTRPTDIIIDDFESELNALTPDARAKNRNWAMNAVFPSVADGGRILMVGTPISEDCFLYYAKDSKIWDAHWFAVCEDLHSALDGDEENAGLLWPDKYNCQKIAEIYDEFKNTGNAHGFFQEYMCQPQSPGEAPFQESYFKEFNAHLDRKSNDWYLSYGSGEGETLIPIDLYMGVDPASSLSIKADYFVIAIVGVDSHDNRYLIDVFRDRIRPSEQPQKIIDWFKKYRPRKTKIESTAYQEALRDGVRAIMRDSGLYIPGIESGLKPRNPKSERLLSLVPHFARGKFFFRPEHRTVKLEFTSYPRGKHDDCFKGDALVKTINGYKEIRDVEIGDLVLTHTGEYRHVTNTIKKPYSGWFHKRGFSGQLDVECSEDHKFYVAKHEYENGKRIKTKYAKRDFVESSSIRKSYHNIVKIDQLGPCENHVIREMDYYTRLSHDTGGERVVVCDREFAYILGLFLAEGHAKRYNNSSGNNNYVFSFAFNTNENELIDSVILYFKKNGCNPSVVVNGNSSVVVIHNKLFWHIFNGCYDGDGEKIMPSFYMKLGNALSRTLDGWLDGDGWVLPNGHYDNYGQSTSKKLALHMRDIALGIGKYAVILKRKVFRYGKRNKDAYLVSIKNEINDQCKLSKLSDNEVGGRFLYKEDEWYEGDVYDLSVDTDHSYTVNGMVVHNCMDAIWSACQGMSPCKRTSAKDEAKRGEREDRKKYDWMSDF